MRANMAGITLRAAVVLGAALLCLSGPLATVALPGWRAPADAPAAWVEYATKLRARAEAVLGAEDEVAQAFRESLERLYALAAQTNSDPAESIAINLWVDPAGQLDRAVLAAFPSAGMNPDLVLLLSRISVGPPPPDMLQPVRLQLRLARGKPQAKP